jgi:hypothetical protein
MKVSLYTAMRDCVRNDYPFLDMLRHHLPLADLFPHNWRDSDFLPDLDIYEGPLIKAVRDNSERVHSGRYAVV